MKLNKINKKILAIFLFSILIAGGIVTGIFYWLYGEAKQNIINMWMNRTTQIAQDVGYYLTTPKDAVAFTALKVNGMMADGVSNEEIQKYLINESEIYELIIEGNESGIYGYCREEYLDGSGWIPDDDYKPKERPWYISAVNANGEVALVKPYKNLQTFTMMMSVSQLLDDKKSVISMDIFLGSVQKIVEKLYHENDIEMAMVIDKSGSIVAHSNEEEVGKSYFYGPTKLKSEIVKNLIKRNDPIFEFHETDTGQNENKNYMILSKEINDDWYVVMVLDEDKIFQSLQSIYLSSALTLFAVFFGILFALFYVGKKHSEAERLGKEMRAVSDVYVAMAMIDTETDQIRMLRTNDTLDDLFEGNFNNYSKRILELTKRLSSDQSRQMMLGFMNPSDLSERLSSVNTISHEFLDNKNCWIRVKFIVVDRHPDGRVYHLLLAFESIDEDRKQQEKLRELSEMDMMTRIRNRGSGEALVRKKMSEGIKGMFCLLDADKFKTVNDTYGHAIGDKVIIAIAECLTKTFRDSDVVFRLGGDEFAVYADGVTDSEIGNRIMERLFHNINNIQIPELEGRKICISVGVTFYPADRNDSFEALYARADEGLYDSKKTEGNFMTICFQEEKGM